MAQPDRRRQVRSRADARQRTPPPSGRSCDRARRDDRHGTSDPTIRPAMAGFDEGARRADDRRGRVRGRAPNPRSRTLQHFLHANPTLGARRSCCCSASLLFSAHRRRALPLSLQPVADHPAGDDHRHPRHRPDADRDPDRRHRPVGRRDHGAVLGRHGQARRDGSGCPLPLALLLGLAVGAAVRLVNGVLVTRLKLPPFIVTLGTWSDLLRAQSLVLRQRDHPRAGHRRQPRRSCRFFGTPIEHRRRPLHLRLDLHAACSCCCLVRRSTARPGAAMSTPSATTPMPRASPASAPTASLLSVYIAAG